MTNKVENSKVVCRHCGNYIGNYHSNPDIGFGTCLLVPYKDNSKVTKVKNYIKVVDNEEYKTGIFKRKPSKDYYTVTETQFKCSKCCKHTTIQVERQFK